jgi:hypothetical protein
VLPALLAGIGLGVLAFVGWLLSGTSDAAPATAIVLAAVVGSIAILEAVAIGPLSSTVIACSNDGDLWIANSFRWRNFPPGTLVAISALPRVLDYLSLAPWLLRTTSGRLLLSRDLFDDRSILDVFAHHSPNFTVSPEARSHLRALRPDSVETHYLFGASVDDPSD